MVVEERASAASRSGRQRSSRAWNSSRRCAGIVMRPPCQPGGSRQLGGRASERSSSERRRDACDRNGLPHGPSLEDPRTRCRQVQCRPTHRQTSSSRSPWPPSAVDVGVVPHLAVAEVGAGLASEDPDHQRGTFFFTCSETGLAERDRPCRSLGAGCRSRSEARLPAVRRSVARVPRWRLDRDHPHWFEPDREYLPNLGALRSERQPSRYEQQQRSVETSVDRQTTGSALRWSSGPIAPGSGDAELVALRVEHHDVAQLPAVRLLSDVVAPAVTSSAPWRG